MAGVRDITPGFAQECFGKLYTKAEDQNAAIRFDYTEENIAAVLMIGIIAESKRPAI
jgi:hypothetical protein